VDRICSPGKVGDHVLAPANTSYDERNLYDTYDVTGQLQQGPNAVGMWLGTGYGPRFSQYGLRWAGPDQAILLLTVTFTDGTQRTVAQAFNAHFLDATGTTYGDGRQVTSVLPLAFGMVPADKVAGVGAHLVDTILTKDASHLDTGVFGTRYLVDALARIGRVDVATAILGQTTYPGFGYEIQRGATTPWEQWTYESNMETHDHAMFAGINASLYTQLAGITPASPGYAAIAIAPRVPAGLEHVSASIDTVRGTVTSAWTSQTCTFDLSVTVPVNAVATVSVPVPSQDSKVEVTPGAVSLPGDATTRRYSVGSGSWQFTVDRCGH
jgi:alpha-L-rhamnosidase